MAEEKNLDILINIMTQELGQERADEVMKKYSEATEDASKNTEKHAGSARMLHRALHGLNEIVPGLGRAMAMAFHAAKIHLAIPAVVGVAVAVAALVKGVELLKEAVKKVKDEWDALEARTVKVEEATDAYHKKLKGLEDTSGDINKNYEHQKAILDALVEKHKLILDLQEKFELAQAGDDKAKQDKVRKKFEDLKGQAAVNKEEAELNLQRNKLFEEEQARDRAKTDAQAMAGVHASMLAKKPPLSKEEKEKIEKDLNKFHISDILGIDSIAGMAMPNFGGIIAGISRIAAQRAKLDRQREFEKAVGKAGEKSGELTDKYTDAEKRFRETREKVSTMWEVLRVHKNTEFVKEHEARINQERAEAEGIAKRFLKDHGSVNADEKKFMIAINGLITGKKQSEMASARMLSALSAHSDTNHNNILLRIADSYENMGKAYDAFDKRMKDLEGKFQKMGAIPPH